MLKEFERDLSNAHPRNVPACGIIRECRRRTGSDAPESEKFLGEREHKAHAKNLASAITALNPDAAIGGTTASPDEKVRGITSLGRTA